MTAMASRGFRLPPGLLDKLEKFASKDRRTVGQLVKIVLEDYAAKRELRDGEKVGGKK